MARSWPDPPTIPNMPPTDPLSSGGGKEGDEVRWWEETRDRYRANIILKRAGIDSTRGLPSKLLTAIGRDFKPAIIATIRINDTLINETKNIVEAFETYYEDLYAKKTIQNPVPLLQHALRLPGKVIRALRPPPDQAEVLATLAVMKKGGSPGPDGIPYDLYKDSPAAVDALTLLFRQVWETGRVPRSWQMATARPLPKDGKDPTLLKSYRPISLTNCDSKILTALINHRLQPYLPELIPKSQTGFIQGRTTQQAILRVATIIREHPKALPILMDFEKAYDRMSHEWLHMILDTAGFPPNLINIITSINTGFTRLLINNTLSRPIPLFSGLKQGDPLSSTLFILCLHPVLTLLENQQILHHAHADDTMVLPLSIRQLRTAMRTLEIYCKASGQQINIEKSTILLKEGKSPPPDFMFDNKDEDRYLGVSLAYNGETSFLPNTMDRYDEALMRWKKRNLSLKERTTVLKMYLRPALLYQAPFASGLDHKWIRNIERWFLQSASATFNELHTYRPWLSKDRETHPISMFGLIPIELELSNRRASIYCSFQAYLPEMCPGPPKGSPLQRMKSAYNQALKKIGRDPGISRQDLKTGLKKKARAEPLPLTRRQSEWERNYNCSIRQRVERLYRWKVRPAIQSFGWKLFNGVLPLGSHFSPPSPCPMCNNMEDTQHLFHQTTHSQATLPTGTKDPLLAFLTSSTEEEDIDNIIILWCIWKLRCWMKHHNGKDYIDIGNLFLKFLKEEKSRLQEAFG